MKASPNAQASIIGIGLAVPEHGWAQDRLGELCVSLCGLEGDAARLARTLHRRSGIERRGCVLLSPTPSEMDADRSGLAPAAIATDDLAFFAPGANSGDRGPTTAARMALYQRLAPPLAARAAAEALRDAGTLPSAITHLVTVSCTGFAAPGADLELVKLLGLSSRVQRVHIGFMGCHGAINALSVARALAVANAHVLVVCVELCSLHWHVTTRPDRLVANSLFADGASACVVVPGSSTGMPAGIELLGTASIIFPGSEAAMAWEIGDHGFEMTLAEGVPGLIREHLRPWLATVCEVAAPPSGALASLHWCVHPGGPRVLDAVQDALALPVDALALSRSVLRDHGNMSSATVLFILQRMRLAGARGPTGMLAFGPGICAEACFVGL
jgi:predicted naringenin-chalcone synthase